MKRSISQDLIDWQHKPGRKPLVLNGARQVGKTYALKEFGKAWFKNTHYLNFEKNPEFGKIFDSTLDPKVLLTQISLLLKTSIDVAKDLVIFDEIQACPRALTSLKYFNEEQSDLALAAAGSLLGLTLSQGSFPVGQVDFLYVYPLSFEEFLLALGEDHACSVLRGAEPIGPAVHLVLWELLKDYFVVGGMPEVVREFTHNRERSHSNLEHIRFKQESLITAYLADIAKHSGKISSMHIERILRNVPAQLARTLDQSAQKYRFAHEVAGLKRYSQFSGAIDWLTATGLVLKIPQIECAEPPLAAHVQENWFKLYFFDVGLMGAIAGLSPQTILIYDYGTYQGYFAENFVAQEWLSSQSNSKLKLYAWKEGQAEIEFLIQKATQVIPVEVKSGKSTRSKSLQSFAHRYHPNQRIILSAKLREHDDGRGINYWPLYQCKKALV